MTLLVLLLISFHVVIGNASEVSSNYVTQDIVGELLKRIDEKDAVIYSLVARVEQLEEKVETLSNEVMVGTVLADVTQYKDTVKKLNDKVNSQADTIQGLQNEMMELKEHKNGHADNSSLIMDAKARSGIRSYPRRAVGHNSRQTMGPAVRNRRHVETPLIAFYVRLKNSQTHLGINQNIRFDTIVTNDGNAYNLHSGTFNAPVSGTYVFSATIVSYPNHNTYFHIIKNDVTIANLYVSTPGNDFDTASDTIIIHANKGDVIAVQNDNQDESIDGNGFTTFSGFLLKEDATSVAGSVIG